MAIRAPPDATIASMAKMKPARGKSKKAQPPPGGVACIVVIVIGMALVMLLLYFVLKSNANG